MARDAKWARQNVGQSWQLLGPPRCGDEEERAAVAQRLVQRGISAELAGVVADAICPFSYLDKWTSDRSKQREAMVVARSMVRALGRYRSEDELWRHARRACERYASLAPDGSEAEAFWLEAAQMRTR